MTLTQKKINVIAALAALALVSALVLRTSAAAFSGKTDNSGNAWETGQIALSDDDTGKAMFTTATNSANMKPGTPVTKCITVTYSGTLAASAVKVYGAAVTGGLADYLNVKIEESTALGLASFADCTGFVAGSTVFDGKLSTFAAKTDYANGAGGTWTPSATDAKRTYKFTISVIDDNAAQGKTATGANFYWETPAA